MTHFDVIRHIVRGSRFADESELRRALTAIDAWEADFPDLESYQAELDKRAAIARRESGAPETDADKAARLEAENEQLRATLNASAGRAAGSAPEPATT